MGKNRIVRMSRIAMMTAAIAVATFISIPLPFTPIPLSLTTLFVMLTGIMLGPIDGMIAALVYLLIGTIGLPVFSGFRSGLAALVGPTGGFLMGYPILSFGTGYLIQILSKRVKPFVAAAVGMVASTSALYIMGCSWYVVYARVTVASAIVSCVLPFLFGDSVKIVVASFVAVRYMRLRTAKE